jgi:uncharacterized phage protein (TIGR02218 family)
VTIPAPLLAHYQTRSTTVADALFIVRTDGERYAFTTHDTDAEIDVSPLLGDSSEDLVTFDAGQGLDATSIVLATGASVGNLEISTLDDGSLFTTDDVMQAKWRDAKFWIFRYNYNSVTSTDDVEMLLAGTIGEIRPVLNMVVVELRGLTQRLKQPIGIVLSKTCRARLGDDACGVDLTPFTFNTTVTGVTSKSVFTCSGLAQAADYFTEGLVTFNTGNNSGVTQKVRLHSTGGVINLSLPMFKTIQVGDTLTIVSGCLKTRDVCRDKFDNVLRMQAEPDAPGIDQLTTTPVPPA